MYQTQGGTHVTRRSQPRLPFDDHPEGRDDGARDGPYALTTANRRLLGTIPPRTIAADLIHTKDG